MLKELSKLGQAKLKNPDSNELTDYVGSLDVNDVSTITYFCYFGFFWF